MKKAYKTPTSLTVELNSGAICATLVVGSGNAESTSGDGTDLVKEYNGNSSSTVTDKSVWDNEW